MPKPVDLLFSRFIKVKPLILLNEIKTYKIIKLFCMFCKGFLTQN